MDCTMDRELSALEMESLTLQIKGPKPKEKAVTLVNFSCSKSSMPQEYTLTKNYTYELHGMEITKEGRRVPLTSTIKSTPGIN